MEAHFTDAVARLAECAGARLSDAQVAECCRILRRYNTRITPRGGAARAQGMSVGVFTDVRYGMPRDLVDEDLRLPGIAGLIDVVLTSRDVGFRKPSCSTAPTAAQRGGNTAPSGHSRSRDKPRATGAADHPDRPVTAMMADRGRPSVSPGNQAPAFPELH